MAQPQLTSPLQARVAHKMDTQANWAAYNPLLFRGELALVQINPGVVKMKVGDGVSHFTSLPYANETTAITQIRAAVPGLNPGPFTGNAIWMTATAGTYVHFPDDLGNSIVVNTGELVYFLDEGTFYSKIVIPTATDFASIRDVNNIYNMVFAGIPTHTSIFTLVDKTTRTNFGFYSGGAPVAGDWYVDMNQSFPLSRLTGILVRNGGAAGPPSIITDCQVVTIAPNNAIQFLGIGGLNNGVVGQATLLDISTDVLTALTNTNIGDLQNCFIAVRDTTANAGLSFDTSPSASPYTVWGYRSLGGGSFGLRAFYPNTDISYEAQLYDELPLQTSLYSDQSVLKFTALNPATIDVSYQAQDDWGVVLYDTVNYTQHGVIELSPFGIRAGKVIAVKYPGGGLPIDFKPTHGAKLEGATGAITVNTAKTFRVIYDGAGGWWVI